MTENFKLGVAAATGGIALVYLFSIFGSFFGINISFLNPNNGSLMSIGASLFIVIIASLNLVMDFDFIGRCKKRSSKIHGMVRSIWPFSHPCLALS